ncbi:MULTISPECIES: site-specific integrase [unclassified Caballeronia]|uniref:site-specific integrase n=1 Tax=unclassified Caballeronia TaxID=2646786 RepID=UPI00285427C0|nr:MULTISPECIES: site-specific integrase [unclassified Caballeronia]MDR5772139.1 site-specific integrase [Caballeronia sp. LZ002]MDR5804428.1 site-specific integrase [Caballeronia sp. LZ001]MDR5847573.1 site-specific integrase [Caballeronia sp. LZ003]
MGTIQVRPNGAYTAKVRRKGYPAQSRTFITKTDAQRWITETEAAMSRSCFVDTSAARQMLLGDAFARYAAEVSPTKRGAAEERVRLAAMQRDPLAAYSLATLKPSVISAWRDRRLLTVSGSTVNREMNLIHHVIEVARKDWDVALPSNPVSDVRRPRSNPGRTRRLSPAEQSLLLHACRQARSWWLAPLVELAIHTGMRQSEVRTLMWENIDLQKRVAILPAAATKTLTMRGVPLSSRCVVVFESLKGARIGPLSGPVFLGVTREAVKLAFKRARNRAGLSDFRFHDTRHEATSRLFELGLNPVEVASVTGHKTQAMLARYTHLQASELAKKLG